MAPLSSKPAMNTEAFKDCDIRGTTPDQVNEDIFARVGREFGRLLARDVADGRSNDTIVIGGDGRHSTPALLEATIRGLSGSPIGIVNLGARVPTPAIYWAKEHFGAHASAIVTASHNPPHWNGLKVMRGAMPPRPEDIRLLADKAGEGDVIPPSGSAQTQTVDSIVQQYMDALIRQFGSQSLGNLKIVVDPGNGCLSGIASHVLREIDADVIPLHDRIDGDFSERNPDCAVAENLTDLVNAVRDEAADFGVGFDGDGDRLAVVDDTGRLLGSERLAMLLFQGAVPLGKDDTVILDNKCSMHLDRTVAALGGRAVRCKSGHAYMKRMVLERGAVAGVELSGHVFLGSINGRDDPLHTTILLAGWLARQNRPMSAFVDAFPKMHMTSDIRIEMSKADIDKLLADCGDGLDRAEVQRIDGVRLVWPNGWLLVRRSITEPKVTIRLEGETRLDLKKIGKLFTDRFAFLRDQIESALAGLSDA
ncbi:MAG: phosphomannomutase/phosphoglucomutase [Rhodobacter sp.]|nr:phosphomannomutase/phosphoglucomutase [Rhodobacter sp.]